MARLAHRRIHLRQRPQIPITIGRDHGEMMRRDFATGDVFVLGEKTDLLFGGDMQHMHTRPCFMRQTHQALGAMQGHLFAAPDGMGGGIIVDAQILALA